MRRVRAKDLVADAKTGDAIPGLGPSARVLRQDGCVEDLNNLVDPGPWWMKADELRHEWDVKLDNYWQAGPRVPIHSP